MFSTDSTSFSGSNVLTTGNTVCGQEYVIFLSSLILFTECEASNIKIHRQSDILFTFLSQCCTIFVSLLKRNSAGNAVYITPKEKIVTVNPMPHCNLFCNKGISSIIDIIGFTS